jgi:hypothetical protein|tara:strand:- start:190 stop:483 length:294 start_codon:yes stop_codon:yes gene_type:complete
MVVKLVEVKENRGVTSGSQYSLREVFINPQRVVSMSEEPRLATELREGKMPEGMNEQQSFTRIVLDQGSGGSSMIVVGSPVMIDQKLTEGHIRLLNG